MPLKLLTPILFIFGVSACQLPTFSEPAAAPQYLKELYPELAKAWPKNRTINLVFHGHSVPAGYFKTPTVNTLKAYPHQLLQRLKAANPRAIINVITTAIGGENAEHGEKRLRGEVLNHSPDVLFIDYALNDRSIGLERAKKAWERMIILARRQGVPVILLTPTPDRKVDLFDDNSILQQHSNQIRRLASTHGVGLVDSYAAFQRAVEQGAKLEDLMAQGNHPNAAGHAIVGVELMRYFERQ